MSQQILQRGDTRRSSRRAANGRGDATGTLVAQIVEQSRFRMGKRAIGSERISLKIFIHPVNEPMK